ncbi:Deoxyribodipyrimidine photo-lyase [Legionella massiliensis]|uniref:Deoxyribodipyrimidine photo-lyase n=1 Tax=Legionella massiliensis TaxID=1034943 RepID=A0A078KVL2_9GAMM|nr:deoxyribodipyrimidine photo-lyase [Legionella massiliensis]CDZ78450.1 Deoxyribodipyrimidine photo-lyase [Legionella massiliensis]CEE14188.1 Deoxyribodipyrimidine photo-lyase [Legionella massiliensis]
MTTALIWFRQDLRLVDNPAFIEACSQHQFVIPLYIYDKQNSVLGAAQAWWLHHSLIALRNSLSNQGLDLVLRKGNPLEIILDLVKRLSVESVYWNRCYEPLVIERDKKIKAALLESGINVQSTNGSLLHEPWTIKNKSGDFFKVFTPYWKQCTQILHIPSPMHLASRPKGIAIQSDEIQQWGLLPSLNWAARFPEFWSPGEEGAQKKLNEFIDYHLKGYKKNRDFPAKNATSRLSPHLHFGEISPWMILRAVEIAKLDPSCDLASAQHFISELGWREFSVYLLYHFPKLASENFRKEFDGFPWRNDEHFLACWQKGLTGYPIIDAGMRELWATGYMHNRVRMIVASFLTKGGLINWRLGADWFLDTLVDADLANNSASWQWVAGSGADAAPYFRIFNPVLQSQKFDSEGTYIRQWVPELAKLKGQSIHAPWEDGDSSQVYLNKTYPRPIVNHQEARARALACYQQLRK